jgi:ABC-type amino acid transport substrate-binding protein
MAAEPFRPFVFPAIWTDEGARITGLDVELARLIAGALSRHCGQGPIVPTIQLVRFRDLFLVLNEGKIDLFVSAVPANIPMPTRAGFGYSIPYFEQAGISGITARHEVVDRVHANLAAQTLHPPPDGLVANEHALEGLTIAVQDGTSAHFYALANLKQNRLWVCDSLPAAFEVIPALGEPPIDVILGEHPILRYMVNNVRKKWIPLTHNTGRPFLLTRTHYAVVMAEESYRLRWFTNSLLFRLEESGRLEGIRTRWVKDSYAFPRRAATEGLPFDIEMMVQQNDQGGCRLAPPVRQFH